MNEFIEHKYILMNKNGNDIGQPLQTEAISWIFNRIVEVVFAMI